MSGMLPERPMAWARQVLIKMDRKYASGIRVGKKVTDESLIMCRRLLRIVNYFDALYVLFLLA
jgi:hypothetical protein